MRKGNDSKDVYLPPMTWKEKRFIYGVPIALIGGSLIAGTLLWQGFKRDMNHLVDREIAAYTCRNYGDSYIRILPDAALRQYFLRMDKNVREIGDLTDRMMSEEGNLLPFLRHSEEDIKNLKQKASDLQEGIVKRMIISLKKCDKGIKK